MRRGPAYEAYVSYHTDGMTFEEMEDAAAEAQTAFEEAADQYRKGEWK